MPRLQSFLIRNYIFGGDFWWKCPAYEIYDIGTKIIFVQCFVTTDMFLFCKPLFFSGICHIVRDLAFGSVKTRFKAIQKSCIFRPRSTCSWTFAPGGRLSYEAYNVEVKTRFKSTYLMEYVVKKATWTFTCSLTFDLHLQFINMFI